MLNWTCKNSEKNITVTFRSYNKGYWTPPILHFPEEASCPPARTIQRADSFLKCSTKRKITPSFRNVSSRLSNIASRASMLLFNNILLKHVLGLSCGLHTELGFLSQEEFIFRAETLSQPRRINNYVMCSHTSSQMAATQGENNLPWGYVGQDWGCVLISNLILCSCNGKIRSACDTILVIISDKKETKQNHTHNC